MLLAATVMAVVAASATPSAAKHWHHHHHWPIITYVSPVALWWNYPYYFYTPRTIVAGVLTHHATEVGPIPVWPRPW